MKNVTLMLVCYVFVIFLAIAFKSEINEHIRFYFMWAGPTLLFLVGISIEGAKKVFIFAKESNAALKARYQKQARERGVVASGLGTLGTVFGIVIAFLDGNTVENSQLGQVLISTGIGLSIQICIFYLTCDAENSGEEAII